MDKNLMPLIAKELGVEIEEEFKITNDYDFYYKFTLNDLLVRDKNEEDWYVSDDEVFIALIRGEEEILKLPFCPNYNEQYWTYKGGRFSTATDIWKGFTYDYISKACGCVFRTKEEAIRERPRIYKELTGKDWSEDGEK